jgi:integrase
MRCGCGLWLPFHSLRHTCATLLAKARVHPKVAQQILRHADVETTLAIYTHVDLGDMREALSRTFAANLLPTGSIPKVEALDQSRFTEKDRGLQMVGATGFEPATTCTPSKCATRLRYAPARSRRWGPKGAARAGEVSPARDGVNASRWTC